MSHAKPVVAHNHEQHDLKKEVRTQGNPPHPPPPPLLTSSKTQTPLVYWQDVVLIRPKEPWPSSGRKPGEADALIEAEFRNLTKECAAVPTGDDTA